MSHEATVWAYQQVTGAGPTKQVLTALADFVAAGTNECWPGQRLLAQMTEQHERSIRRHLDRLEELGLIEREPRMRPDGRGRSSDLVRLTGDFVPGYKPQPSGRPTRSQRHSSSNRPDRPVGQGDSSKPSGDPEQPDILSGLSDGDQPDSQSGPTGQPVTTNRTHRPDMNRKGTVIEPVPPSAGADAPPTAQDLVGEYIDRCDTRPPNQVIGQLSRHIKGLLQEGFDPDAVRSALHKLRAKSLHPSTLPSLVDEVVNATVPSGPPGAGGVAAEAWLREAMRP